MSKDYNHLEEKLRKERKKKKKVSKSSGTLAGQVERMKTSKGYTRKKS